VWCRSLCSVYSTLLRGPTAGLDSRLSMRASVRFLLAWEVLRQVVPYNLYDFQQTRHAIEWTDSHYPPMCFYVSNCCASETMVSVDLIPNADFRASSTVPSLYPHPSLAKLMSCLTRYGLGSPQSENPFSSVNK